VNPLYVFYAFIMSLTLFFGLKAPVPLSALLFFFAGFLLRHVVDMVRTSSTPKKGP
jgi:hypothetical protein